MFQLMKQHSQPLHAGAGQQGHRHAEGPLPQGLRDDRRDGGADKTMTICYALGWTQHSVGSQNIRTMAMVQLLLGNMGMAGGGMNALRGHPTSRASPTCACIRPSAARLPDGADRRRQDARCLPGGARAEGPAAEPDELPQNFPKWFSSLMKAWYGNAATKDNDFCYDWLPKKDAATTCWRSSNACTRARWTVSSARASTPGGGAEQAQGRRGAGQAQSTWSSSTRWSPTPRNSGSPRRVQRGRSRQDPDRGVPVAVQPVRRGRRARWSNSGRVVQWHWQAAEAVRAIASDTEVVARLFQKLKAMYAEGDGGAFPSLSST